MNGLALLILAGIAAFFFFQIRSVLGQVPQDYEKKTSPKTGASKDIIIEHIEGEIPAKEVFNKALIIGNEEEKQNIVSELEVLSSRYKEFSLNKFIEGAKSAYNMILDAFTVNKLKDVKPFISEDIYSNFSKLRSNYAEKNYEYINVITHIESVLVKNVNITNNTAYITVEIHSNNVTALKDAQGNIIQGNADIITSVKDIWEFKRDFSETSPIWILTSIHS